MRSINFDEINLMKFYEMNFDEIHMTKFILMKFTLIKLRFCLNLIFLPIYTLLSLVGLSPSLFSFLSSRQLPIIETGYGIIQTEN